MTTDVLIGQTPTVLSCRNKEATTQWHVHFFHVLYIKKKKNATFESQGLKKVI